jgi:hypothetical protein
MTVRPDQASLDVRPVPPWYTDAKLGIFVHWGLYSIPAFAERTGDDYTAFMRDLTTGKDTRGRIPYAEWYLLVLPASSRIRMLNGSVDLSWTQAADGVRIAAPQHPANPRAQVLQIIASAHGRDG